MVAWSRRALTSEWRSLTSCRTFLRRVSLSGSLRKALRSVKILSRGRESVAVHVVGLLPLLSPSSTCSPKGRELGNQKSPGGAGSTYRSRRGNGRKGPRPSDRRCLCSYMFPGSRPKWCQRTRAIIQRGLERERGPAVGSFRSRSLGQGRRGSYIQVESDVLHL